VIVGVERAQPDTTAAARRANFSNEAGALGGVRFLKNVVGFWILERCRPKWGDPPITVLIEEATRVSSPVPIFDAGDHRFVNPEDMEAEIRRECGFTDDTPRGVIVRSILESIAAGVGRVVDELGEILNRRPRRAAVVGGGTRASLFHRLIADRCGLDVIAGSPEAAALGNALVQGLALGRFGDLDEARTWVEFSGELV
jgi:rhamnulokinase